MVNFSAEKVQEMVEEKEAEYKKLDVKPQTLPIIKTNKTEN